MSFICPVCDNPHKDRICPTCTSRPKVCPKCNLPYINIRYLKKSDSLPDRLFIHKERTTAYSDKLPNATVEEACYVKGT